ncbi:MAG TPA: DUF6151 family protein [Xanthomonadales bacterium]|nr:DUF6151 family protein [Xanthomonadales bacterium]
MTDIPIRCSCGSFKARVERAGPGYGNRVVCYCDFCQEFARHLGRENEILDEHGGSDIYQVSSGRLKITEGKEHLACVYLTARPILRWYTACCNTPVGNTLGSNKLPFIGLLHNCIDTSAQPGGLDELIGPIVARVNGGSATGDTSHLDIHDSSPLKVYWRFAKTVLPPRITGEHKKSPLFDQETGKPVVKPIRREPPYKSPEP